MTSFTRLIVDMISGVYKVQNKNYKKIIWGGNIEPDTEGSPVTYNIVARPGVTDHSDAS